MKRGGHSGVAWVIPFFWMPRSPIEKSLYHGAMVHPSAYSDLRKGVTDLLVGLTIANFLVEEHFLASSANVTNTKYGTAFAPLGVNG